MVEYCDLMTMKNTLMVSYDFSSETLKIIRSIFKDIKALRIYSDNLILVGSNNKVIDERYVDNPIQCYLLEKLIMRTETFYKIDCRNTLYRCNQPIIQFFACTIITDVNEFNVLSKKVDHFEYNNIFTRFFHSGYNYLYFGKIPIIDQEKFHRRSNVYFMDYYVDTSKKKIVDTRAGTIHDYTTVVINDMS